MIRLAIVLGMCVHCVSSLSAEDPGVQTPREVRFDVFVRSDHRSTKQVLNYVEALKKRVAGLDIRVHDLIKDRSQLSLLVEISKAAGRDKPVLPAFHCCQRTYFGFITADRSGPEIEKLFTADVYTRATCSRCNKLKAFLPGLQKRWPAIRFRIYEVDDDSNARARWEALCRGSGVPPGLPTIDFARRVIIGYQGDEVTGAQIESLIQQVSGASSALPSRPGVEDQSNRTLHPSAGLTLVSTTARPSTLSRLTSGSLNSGSLNSGSLNSGSLILGRPRLNSATYVRLISEDVEQFDTLELPGEAEISEIGELATEPKVLQSESSDEAIEVPIWGRLRVDELGMPLFTLVVGLVDGFNPCAMWILVFLLSVLVNIKDRKKIVIIAGTFVVVSGLAYFAFMAAWLNLFILVGIIRPVQIALGGLALLIGVVNVKDFFAFKKGISFSIPERHKPGLYRRVREIVSAKYLTVALSGAIALAVIVNMIELLCTAGLPALYTQILTLQNFPVWENYLYLGLYILAYMFDDALLVTIVVVTLSHHKLQEREGRWLKLISGIVILLLGLVMLFRPQWLQFSGV
ncbi:putative membrane protein [Rhodopirellula maiorica SM1]|uniref:Putative membrane protein n=1 Tax=Rhodopirellula maiorica SM1 TaxID=1265738 RepID=M5RST7_9BACT|nr:putative membrane protein [Rhodopirellula maiorica]EMI18452.1 putative membrane protein [Rhodopirellula maiorica SM1]